MGKPRSTKKKSTPVTAGKPAKPAKPPRTPDPLRAARARRIRHVLQNALGTVAVAAIVFVGYRAAWNHVKTSDVPADAPPLVLEGLPAWIEADNERVIRDAAEPVPAANPLDAGALQTVHARLSAEPWVKQVRQVRREPNGRGGTRVVVDAEYRAPAVLLRESGYYRVVGRDGHKLPLRYGSDQIDRVATDGEGGVRIREVIGVAAPAPDLGDLWAGDDLEAALEMDRLLAAEPWGRLVQTIDVRNHGGRLEPSAPQIVLWTTEGTALRWGRAPGDEDPLIEATTQRKLENVGLMYARSERTRIDYGCPWVDLRRNVIGYPADAAAALPMTAAQER